MPTTTRFQRKAEAPKASEPTKPDSLEDVPSKDLIEGFKEDWDGKFLEKYSAKEISQWISRLSGVKCEAKKVGPALIGKLRKALRMVSEIHCSSNDQYKQT
jgi:hypothetical protein